MATTKATELGQFGSKLTVHNNNITLDGTVHGQHAGFDSDFTAKSTSDLSEGTNLYYTDTRADARADVRIAAATTADLTEGSNLYYTTSRGDSDTGVYISGNRTYGNITTTGYIAGPATMTIDPAAVGDNTGTLVIAGNLQVDGTTTTINSTTMEVDDLNLTLASGAANAAAASGAGITVQGASAQLTYDAIQDRWNMNKGLELLSSPLVVGTGTTDVGRVENSAGVFSLYAYTGRQIVFGNDTNGEHVRIDADGNVGIGDTNPAEKFTIKGDGARMTISSNDYEVAMLGRRGSTAPNWDRGYLRMKYDGANTVVLDTDGVSYLNGGNVGIGTTSPGAKLHVDVGAPSSTDQILGRFQSQDSRQIGFVWDDSQSTLGIATLTNHKMVFHTNGNSNPRMTITQDGDVGIGATNPGGSRLYLQDTHTTAVTNATTMIANTTLTINGNSSQGSDVMRIGPMSTSGKHFIDVSNSAGNAAYDLLLNPISGGNVGIGATSSGYKLQVDHGTSSQYASSIRNTADNLQLLLGTTTGGLLNIQGKTISSNAAYQIALQSEGGNVGIGTASPAAKLHLDTASSGMPKIRFTHTNAGGDNFEIGSGVDGVSNGGWSIRDIDASANRFVINSSGNVGIGVDPYSNSKLTIGGTDASGYSSVLMFDNNASSGAEFFMLASDTAWTAGANKFIMGHGAPSSSNVDMTITSNGSVGIGTYNPVYKLHVNSGATNVVADFESTDGIAGIRLRDNSGNVELSASGNDFRVQPAGGGVAFVVNNGGNVGVGTTNPGNTFTVNGGTESVGVTISDTARLTIGADGTWNYFKGKSGNGHYFNTTGGGLVVLNNAGNVGIGTTGPNESLHIYRASGDASFKLQSSTQQMRIDQNSIRTTTNSNISIFTNGNTNQLFLNQSTGNVGIGTSSPGYKLDVSGNFRSTGSIEGSNYNGTFKIASIGSESYDINNRTTKAGAGTVIYSAYPSGSNSPHSYDVAVQFPASGRAMEFSASWISSTAGPLYFRTLRDCCINWSSWSSISMSTVSDRRVKDNIVDYTSSEARTLIEQLQAVEYDYVNHDGTKGNIDLEDPDADLIPRPREIGYIAQDVEDVIPYAVDFNAKTNTPNEHGWASAYTVNYERLVPVLTEALKDVYSKLDSLQTQLDSANQEIQRLKDG